jgi:uncharacterized protein
MYPQALIHYLVYFHADRDYFECHEVLEEYWKSLPPSERSGLWVGLIQIAVGLYHQRRGNFAGAAKMLGGALQRLTSEELNGVGLDGSRLLKEIEARKEEVQKQAPYTDLSLPISSAALLQACEEVCGGRGVSWMSATNPQNEYLIHKHKLRDRTDVIAEREKAIQERK